MINDMLKCLLLIMLILLTLIVVGFVICVYITYGNTPFNELPAWAIPFFLK